MRRLLLTAFLFLPTAAAGQPPGGDSQQRLESVIEELRGLLDRAEQERSADPWLIQDMRAVLDRYDWPWTRRIYAEDFTRLSRLPQPWRVVQGEFRVDRQLGLRTIVEPAAPAREAERAQSEQGGDAMRQLLGEVLEQALGGGRTRRPEGEQAQPADLARALAPMQISNAFALRVELSARDLEAAGGSLVLGPYQGQEGEAGYRLAYYSDAAAGERVFELAKRSPRGTVSTIDYYEGEATFSDGEEHVILWTRDEDGDMRIDLDDRKLMDVRDRGFQEPFAGLAVLNHGGDYAISSLVIQGTE